MSAAAWAQGTGPQGQVGPDSSPVCGCGCLAQPGVPVGRVWGLGPRRLLEPSGGSTEPAPAPNAPGAFAAQYRGGGEHAGLLLALETCACMQPQECIAAGGRQCLHLTCVCLLGPQRS